MSESIYTLRVSRAAAGAYPTISDALAAADQLYPDAEQPVMIRVEPGEYRERVEIRRPHVTIEGETADSVHIMGGLGAKMPRRTARARTARSARLGPIPFWSMPTTCGSRT